VIAIRDLSERTMRLSLERLMGAAGHELKTPVAALHGYLQLVERHLDAKSSPQAHTYADRALVQTRKIGELVDRLFDVSRIQAGRLELVAATIDLVTVVRDAVNVAETLPNAPTIQVSPSRARSSSGRMRPSGTGLRQSPGQCRRARRKVDDRGDGASVRFIRRGRGP